MKKLFIVILTMAFAVATFTAFGCKKQADPGRTSSAHVHDYGEWQTVEEATFEKDGLEERFCKGCNERETRIVLKKKRTDVCRPRIKRTVV